MAAHKALTGLLVLGMAAALSAQVGPPTNPFSSNGAPDVIGAASNGPRSTPTWGGQSQGQGRTSQGRLVAVTGKVTLDDWGNPQLQVGRTAYSLLSSRGNARSLGLVAGETVTVEGTLVASLDATNALQVLRVTKNGRSSLVAQSFGSERHGERDDEDEWGERD